MAILLAGSVGIAAVSAQESPASGKSFIHPGLLHREEDFARMRAKVSERAEPWFSGWSRLAANKHADLAWTPRAVPVVYRGFDKIHPENYSLLFNDAAAAYACALRWKVSGETAYADKAVEILDAWAGTLASIQGTSDRFLASGIYGYELANAAEIIRSYPGWTEERFFRFRKMMLEVFYPMNHDFLVHHNGAKIDHYWANWDLCNMASLLSIGVLADRRDIYDETLAYFRDGAGNGSIRNVVSVLYPDVGLGQWQESGRDQGHCLMGIGILGAICEMAWNQGDDLYGYDDNRFLKGAEYVAKYNLGLDVPYTSYQNSDVTQPVISDKGRGEMRPSWELVYNHYVRRKGLKAPFVEQMAAKVRPEGGGGDYGPKSGGFDQLGYGTLTATLESSTSPR